MQSVVQVEQFHLYQLHRTIAQGVTMMSEQDTDLGYITMEK